MAELSSANLIITLDQESEEYAKSRKFYIRGQVRPIGMFLPAGESPLLRTHLNGENHRMQTLPTKKLLGR